MSAVPIEDDGPASAPRRGPQIMTSRRVAIILFNLGGPDSPKAVQPFLFNLFNDHAIIGLPQPFRFLLAQLISRRRNRAAQVNYAHMGGRSPLLPETVKQAEALEAALRERVGNVSFKCFPAMRYWHPLTKQVAKAVEGWGATDAILLPLYPQFSSTTTASSLAAWKRVSDLPSSTICCYPSTKALAEAHAQAIMRRWQDAGSPPNPHVLFSAHGLPQRLIDRGDPYQWQIEQTVAAVVKHLPAEWAARICYQSRVGPLKWLGPSTPDAIRDAAKDNAGVIVSPIAFVSDHIETLVELDIEYATLAENLGVPFYLRVPALGATPRFIDALADLAELALKQPGGLQSENGGRLCPAQFGMCAQRS